MRRLQALLITGLAVAPMSALAAPNKPNPETTETFESFTITNRARLGVLVMQLTPELRTHFGATADRGVLVGRVEPKSAAAAAGLAVGDVITEVRGNAVDDARDMISALAPAKGGEKVTLQVIRDGKPLALTATMRDSPAPTDAFERHLESTWPRWFHELFDWPPGKQVPERSTST